jgi:hypothetical protein
LGYLFIANPQEAEGCKSKFWIEISTGKAGAVEEKSGFAGKISNEISKSLHANSKSKKGRGFFPDLASTAHGHRDFSKTKKTKQTKRAPNPADRTGVQILFLFLPL